MACSIDFDLVRRRLAAGAGGYEAVHTSPGIELGVYVLVAPEPDRQQPHEDDEVYVVLEGSGVLEIEGETVELKEGRDAPRHRRQDRDAQLDHVSRAGPVSA